jgi:hypothetical protein
MPATPDGCLTFEELTKSLRVSYREAADFPSHQRLRHAASNGLFETVRVGGRVFVPKSQIPLVVRLFRLDYRPSLPLADVAD